MKKFLITLFLLIALLPFSYAQATGEAIKSSLLDDPLLPFYIAAAFVFILAIQVLVVALYMLQVLNIMVRRAEKEKAKRLSIEYKAEPSMLQRTRNRKHEAPRNKPLQTQW